MKDAKGHGSNPRGGGNIGDTLYRLTKPPSMIPGYNAAHLTGIYEKVPSDPTALVSRLRAGVLPKHIQRASGTGMDRAIRPRYAARQEPDLKHGLRITSNML